MDKLTFTEALKHIKDSQAVYTLTNSRPAYFFFSNDQIRVISPNFRYNLSFEQFSELYQDETFYLYNNGEQVVDEQKDQDYYSWKARGIN